MMTVVRWCTSVGAISPVHVGDHRAGVARRVALPLREDVRLVPAYFGIEFVALHGARYLKLCQ